MKTLDMMILARENGSTYIVDDLAYNAKQGFHDYAWGDSWEGSAFPLINDIMELEWSKMED